MAPRNLIRRLAVAALATLLACVAAEVCIRAFVTVRNVGPSFSTWDAELGKRLKPSFTGERITPEFRMRISTNSLGWRGPEPSEPPTNVLLFLGDSFTMGYGVDDGEEFPRLAGELLGRPVLNMGMGANGQARWLRLLRNEAGRYRPAYVVLQLCSNDWDDNLDEGLARLDDGGSLMELPPSAPGWLVQVQRFIDAVPGLSYSHLISFGREFSEQIAARPMHSQPPPESAGDSLHPGLGLSLALLEASIEHCRAAGWPCLVLSADLEDRQLAPVLDVVRRRSVSLVRMPAKKDQPDLYYAIDGHWTPKGHREAALRVARALGR